MQLDMQYQEYRNKNNGAQSEMARREEEILKVTQRNLEEKQRIEDDKKSNLINQQKSAAVNSLNEMNVLK